MGVHTQSRGAVSSSSSSSSRTYRTGSDAARLVQSSGSADADYYADDSEKQQVGAAAYASFLVDSRRNEGTADRPKRKFGTHTISSHAWEGDTGALIKDLISRGGSSAGVERDSANLAKFSQEPIHGRRAMTFDAAAASRSSGSSTNSSSSSIMPKGKGNYDSDVSVSVTHDTHSGPERPILNPEVTRTIKYITSLLQHYDQPFEAKRLGFAMVGLSRLSGHIPEVQQLLTALAARAKGAWGGLTDQELSMALHGK